MFSDCFLCLSFIKVQIELAPGKLVCCRAACAVNHCQTRLLWHFDGFACVWFVQPATCLPLSPSRSNTRGGPESSVGCFGTGDRGAFGWTSLLLPGNWSNKERAASYSPTAAARGVTQCVLGLPDVAWQKKKKKMPVAVVGGIPSRAGPAVAS